MKRIRMVLPKGRMFENVLNLLKESGISIRTDERSYRPYVNSEHLEVKLMKAQNIPKLIEIGSHDIGFTGYDWIEETGSDVEELLDTGFDTVSIVSAVPTGINLKSLEKKRRIIVASEYENITKNYLRTKGITKYIFVRTFGATEVFPPDDADMIVDNMATGKTLKSNNLKIMDKILSSSTRFIANKHSMNKPFVKSFVSEMLLLFQSVINGQQRVMLEMNVPRAKFDFIVKRLPCMRSPTVAPLYGEEGFAVKIAVKKDEASKLIPKLKEWGATDILEYAIRKVTI
ncbi:MAG: ATP phosphoribosyltransferase [Deltaproteobacteria bacterium]|nr:ATP phosphoribosyltransferase [Deltaproteobacteria bacterium]